MIAAFEHKGADGHSHINEETGVVTCRWEGFALRASETCDRENSFQFALEYARNNQLFLDDFAAAWTKVVTNNQPNLQRVDPPPFRDSRNDAAAPTAAPILVVI